MTKKDYELLAKVFSYGVSRTDLNGEAMRLFLASKLVMALQIDNIRFDSAVWYRAANFPRNPNER